MIGYAMAATVCALAAAGAFTRATDPGRRCVPWMAAAVAALALAAVFAGATVDTLTRR